MTSKDVIKWVYGKVREELTIQKPKNVPASVRGVQFEVKPETREERIFKTGMNGIAMVAVVCVVMAFLIF